MLRDRLETLQPEKSIWKSSKLQSGACADGQNPALRSKEGGENVKWETPEGMDEYLQSTELCDSTSEQIVAKAEELTMGAETPKEAAMKVFYFVRDQIPFTTGRADARASDSLAEGRGFCVTKPNLQIALLRAMGIPARYRHLCLKKEVLKGILPDWAYDPHPDTIGYHPWCECYLSGKWTVCEPLFDKPLYNAAVEAEFLSTEDVPSIDWDGNSDLKVVTPWILEDKGTFASLDDLFRAVQAEYGPDFATQLAPLVNQHIDSLRNG